MMGFCHGGNVPECHDDDDDDGGDDVDDAHRAGCPNPCRKRLICGQRRADRH